MNTTLSNLTIGGVADAASVNVETIRFYQRKKLLPEPLKPYGSVRRYGAADIQRIQFIKSAQQLGFTLDEIAELLLLADGTHCQEAQVLAEKKLVDVRNKLQGLLRMESVLETLVSACRTKNADDTCPMIDALTTHNTK